MLSKSFGVDHLKLNTGIYLAEVNELCEVITLDIRIHRS